MELNKEIIKGHVESIILSLLQEKDLYGYEISKLIRENSKEAFEVKDGTLYVVLKRLEKLGLVISYWGDCKSGGGRRKYFKITEDGVNYLKEKKSEWEFLKSIMNIFLGENRMREIDNYIDSLYKNIDGISKENKEIKETMRTHLIESVEELKLEGFSEKESIKIALERFGEINEIRGELKTVVERGVKPLLYTVGISLIILIAFFTHLIFMRFDYIKLLALIIIAVPMYIIIRGGVLIYYKVKGIKYDIDWKKELYKFLFANYFIFLVGWYIFPIEVGGSSNVNFQVDLIPFKSYIELMNRGITIGYLMKWIIIRLILFIPLGFYPAFLKGKFNNIAGCVLVASIVYFIVPILELILSFGLISIPIIYIGIDYWVISIIGVLLGYFLYNSIAKKHI